MTRVACFIFFVYLFAYQIMFCEAHGPHVAAISKDTDQKPQDDGPTIIRGSEIKGFTNDDLKSLVTPAGAFTNNEKQKPVTPRGAFTNDEKQKPVTPRGAFTNDEKQKPVTPASAKASHQKQSVNEPSVLRDSERIVHTDHDQDGQKWIRDIVVHLLGVIEQINNKLENLGSKVDSLDQDIREVKSQIVSVAGNQKGDILAVEQRLTSKVTSELSHMVDKVELLQYRGAGRDRGGEANNHLSLSELRQQFEEFSDHITDNFTHAFDTLKRGVDCRGHDSLDTVHNTSNDCDSHRQLVETMDEQRERITADVFERVKTELLPADKIQTNQSISPNLTDATNTIIHKVETMLQEAFMPSKCVRGMIAAPYSTIYPSSSDVITVPYVCDSHTSGGGWILFQRRQSGSTSFNRNWQAYKQGFGPLTDDHWLGLDAVHNLTSSGDFELRIDLLSNGKPYFAEYTSFAVASEAENYVLQIGNYSGTAGDSLSYHRWMPFSAADKDNDKSTNNCAADHKSAWWYLGCSTAELNYNSLVSTKAYWQDLGGATITQSEMKLRRVDKKK